MSSIFSLREIFGVSPKSTSSPRQAWTRKNLGFPFRAGQNKLLKRLEGIEGSIDLICWTLNLRMSCSRSSSRQSEEMILPCGPPWEEIQTIIMSEGRDQHQQSSDKINLLCCGHRLKRSPSKALGISLTTKSNKERGIFVSKVRENNQI